jgi:hypothetical protein
MTGLESSTAVDDADAVVSAPAPAAGWDLRFLFLFFFCSSLPPPGGGAAETVVRFFPEADIIRVGFNDDVDTGRDVMDLYLLVVVNAVAIFSTVTTNRSSSITADAVTGMVLIIQGCALATIFLVAQLLRFVVLLLLVRRLVDDGVRDLKMQ